MEFVHKFLSDDGFMPHGHCYLWDPALVKLHVISDFLIAAAFFTIPFTLINFVRRRKDLPFNWMFVLFGIFIIACGMTHVMEIWTLWRPYYWISGAVKAITALASVPTAILLIRLIPNALKIPGPSVLQATNEALTEQTRLLNLICSNMGDGLLVVDENGRCLLSNSAAKRMFGLQPYQDLPENCLEECGFYHPDKVTRFSVTESPTGRAMRGESVDGEEIFVSRLNGGPGTWSNVTARPLRDENSLIHGAVAVFRDISAQKLAAAQHENLRRERAARIDAEEENQAKDRFLAMLGHELRTPLTPVLASVELLEQEVGAGSEAQSAVTVIRRNVELEARLIDDILDLSAIRKGKIGLHLESVDIHTVLRNALSIFQLDIDRKGFETQFTLHAGEHFVRADPSRLMQIFWNLIKNAIKFTPAGGKLIFSSRNQNGQIEVEVRDNGAGIAPELLARIFDSFEQGTRQVEDGYGGLGLGLTISKAIADAHNSELSASSAGRDQGAAFTLKMNVVAAPPSTSRRSVRAADPLGAGNLATAERPRQALRILLVDDHRDTLRTLKILLTRLGYGVVTAESMSEALREVEAEHFDLLVSDIGLPDGSGLDLMKQIRKRQGIDGIALSGFGMEDDLRKSREAGFVDHLIKPVNLDRLQAAIQRFETQLN
jgi:PAS domain S-box-containing protein